MYTKVVVCQMHCAIKLQGCRRKASGVQNGTRKLVMASEVPQNIPDVEKSSRGATKHGTAEYMCHEAPQMPHGTPEA